MKKILIFALLMSITTTCFAGAVDPCRMLAYEYCAEKLKFKSPVNGPNGMPYCTVNPSTPEFNACQNQAIIDCRAGKVLDLTQKPC